MLDFTFTDEQEILRSSVREFSQREIVPKLKEMFKARKIPDSVVEGLKRMNLLGMTVPEEYGGMGADGVTAGIVGEELARADPTISIPVMFLVDNAWAYLISKYGSDELKEEVLPKVARGESLVGIASTEPNFGSDIGSMTSRADKKGNNYVLNGEKSFVSLVRDIKERSGGFVTVTKTDPSKGTSGVSLFYMPYVEGKFDITYLEEMGREGSSWGAFRFHDIEVGKKNLLGEENKGFKLIHEGFELARGLISVISAGAAAKSIENGVSYMKTRKAFGQPIGKNQGLQFQLADNVARIDAARWLGYQALWVYDQEQQHKKFTRFEVSKKIAEAKLLSTTWAFEAINDAMQWQGAFGYSKDCPEEWALRAIRSFYFAEGSREIMKYIIARESLGRDFLKQ